MAVSLLSHEVSDLCLGKPPLRCLSAVSATVADAVAALKSSAEPFLTVWNCNHHHEDDEEDGSDCECVGKICMADVICYLSKDDNILLSPSAALKAPLSVLLPKTRALVVHVQPSCSLIEAMDLIIRGAQNLIVPILAKPMTKRRQQSKNAVVSLTTTTVHRNGRQFCWISQEDIIRFLLGSIGLFSPLPAISIADLGIINTTSSAILAVDYSSPAVSAVPAISLALADQTSVAVVTGAGDPTTMTLVGEISPLTLACCDESAAGAVATLSAGDLMAYIDGGGPPEDLLRVVRDRLEERGMVELVESLSLSSSSSSDEECTTATKTASYRRWVRSEARVCNKKSSLMAVMIQAIAHRVSYVWVVEKDCSLVGIVTFADMLKVFRDFLVNSCII